MEWSTTVDSLEPSTAKASMEPGGSVKVEHHNVQGLNRSLIGTVTSNNLLNPKDNRDFNLENVHPNLDGLDDPRNQVFRSSCFNTWKISPVFTVARHEEAPAICVNGSGIKATFTDNLTRQSKATYGLILEKVATQDETNTICTNGAHALPNHNLTVYRPPTTLSGTGVDNLVLCQANLTRDNTRSVNGTRVGARDVLQVEQGVAVGSNFSIFNRHQLSMTRFIQLKDVVNEGAEHAPPPVLVLNGRYGDCLGPFPTMMHLHLGVSIQLEDIVVENHRNRGSAEL